MNEQELIDNPETLLALFQQSVQQLIEQRPDTNEQEAQLRAVAKAIEQLEKQHISVPDSLRQTKMMLVDQIGQYAEFNHRLVALGSGLADVLDMIEEINGKPPQEQKSEKDPVPRHHRSKNNGLRTPHSVLKNYVFEALTESGGSAHCSEVIERMQQKFGDQWLPGDLAPHKVYGAIWQYNTHWAYQKLIHEGIACRSSQRGYWQLVENQS